MIKFFINPFNIFYKLATYDRDTGAINTSIWGYKNDIKKI